MRLFVAVNLPVAERLAAWTAAAPLREASLPVKWVAADALHVTLKFLGEVNEARAEDVGMALEGAVRGVKAFELGIGGFGAFPDLAHPKVVWCGIETHPALELLANDVERAVQPFGFGSELQPFRPHVTLGRAKQGAKRATLAGLAKLLPSLEYASLFPVESVDLMHSMRGPNGSVYTVRRAARLEGGGA